MFEKQISNTPVLSAVSATAAEASRTAEIDVRCTEQLGIGFNLTMADGSSASAMTLTIYKSADGGSSYQRVQSIAVLSGTGTMSNYTLSHAVTASDSIWADLDVRNCSHVKIIAAITGGGASDLLTVRVCHGLSGR